MPLNPARPDLVGRLRRSNDEMRLQRTRPRGHTESKTFLVGGGFSTTTTIPPFFVGLDADDETPEFKYIIGFAAVLHAGTATIDWQLNGGALATGHGVTTSPSTVDLDTPVDLAHADMIQPVVTAASGASGLAAAVFIVTGT